MAQTEHDLELPSAPASVGGARRFVGAALEQLDALSLSEVAALLTSELVTNAVVHAAGSIRIRVSVAADLVRIAVADESSMMPAPRLAGDGAVTGRGLALVEQLAERWGSDPHEGGKEVWFELRL